MKETYIQQKKYRMIPAAGYNQGEINITESMQRLEHHIVELPGVYKKFSVDELLRIPAPGKWSKKEILGHLIDSAINNLKRFTEIQFLAQPYRIISYQQQQLVAVNNYQELPIEHLLQLWKGLNTQIIFVVKNIPPEKLEFIVDPQYDNKETKTLGWVIADYVAHMEHHICQVFL